MRTALATIAIHAGLLAALLAMPHDEPAPTLADPVIHVVDVVAPPKPKPIARRDAGGGRTGPPAPAGPVAIRAPAPLPVTARAVERAVADVRVDSALSSPTSAAPASFAIDAFEPGLGDGGRGRGIGGGDGDGVGGGRGPGLGAPAIASVKVADLAIPVARVSKARPARLVYPARNRDAEASELFVARLEVDRDGYVTGARLVHGFGGHRDEVALQLVWRFRYDPARDDEGRPIRSTVDQSFLVGG